MSQMNPQIAKFWVSDNSRLIIQRGKRSLKFTPMSPIDFVSTAQKAAFQAAKGTADLALFEKEFWRCYFEMLQLEPFGDLTIVVEDEEMVALITGTAE